MFYESDLPLLQDPFRISVHSRVCNLPHLDATKYLLRHHQLSSHCTFTRVSRMGFCIAVTRKPIATYSRNSTWHQTNANRSFRFISGIKSSSSSSESESSHQCRTRRSRHNLNATILARGEELIGFVPPYPTCQVISICAIFHKLIHYGRARPSVSWH